MTLSGHLLAQSLQQMDTSFGSTGLQPLQTPTHTNGYRNNNNNGNSSYRASPAPYNSGMGMGTMAGNDGSQWGAHHGSPMPWNSQFGGGGPGRFTQWSEERVATMQARLQRKLGPEYVSTRPGPGGGPKLSYIEGWKAVNLANDVFGFNGWSSSIVSLKTDFMDVNGEGRCNVGITCVVRITLQDGCYHEDIGYGHCENMKGKANALEKAQKEAVTDAVKRAMKHFGNVLGNCLYDRDYTKEVGKMRVPMVKLNANDLERRAEFAPQPAAGPSRAAASAVPQHVSGNSKPPPPAVRTPTRPPSPEPPLRSINDEFSFMEGDSEFAFMEEESFFDDMQAVAMDENIDPAPPAPRSMATAAAPASGAPAYQHRHRPDKPLQPAQQAAPAKVPTPPKSLNESAKGGDAEGGARKQVGGFAKPNGGSTSATSSASSASSRRLAAIMAASGNGAPAPAPRGAESPPNPAIPGGGVNAVAARAVTNLKVHGANLEINSSDQLDTTPGKYSAFTSARGVKREGSQSPSKGGPLHANGAPRVALSEETNTTDWQAKRSRIM